ncbi:MAG: hypothetical protein AB7I30_05435 [Isosphaeraceae bacterium]
MTIVGLLRNHSPGLTLGLAITLACHTATTASAQFNPSSGSGPGTGTGMSGGASRNTTGTGLESGGMGSPTGTGYESGGSLRLPGADRYTPMPRGLPRVNPNEPVPFGPGIDVTFPDEQPAIPLDALLGTDDGGPRASERSTVTEVHLDYAKRIPVPGERSLALSRIASAATFSNQLDMAERALDAASEAAFATPPGLIQDQRLISILTALNTLAEARLREGRVQPDPLLRSDSDDKPAEAMPEATPYDPVDVIRSAMGDWRRAATLAQRITNRTFRTEYMARVAESMAYGSSSILNDFPAAIQESTEAEGFDTSYGGLPDQLLREARELASKIDRPVWHDQALVVVSAAAADSNQYARAVQIARTIPNPEVRTNALIKVAEVQARRRDPDGATSSYRLAAEAVASITQDDPRAVLAGVLIDSLITVGRFEDARASVSLYSEEAQRIVALGAIAESQGRRGAGTSALKWINAEMPARYRSWLYRKVNNGVVAAIEQNRSRDLTKSAE